MKTVDTVEFSTQASASASGLCGRGSAPLAVSPHAVHGERTTVLWDRVGIFLSGLCALHCLLTPFVVLLIPTLDAVFHSHWVHLGLALFVVPVGVAAFILGYRHHRNKGILALGLLGMAALVSASILPHEWVEVAEIDVVTILGSFILLSAHFWNRRACTCHHRH